MGFRKTPLADEELLNVVEVAVQSTGPRRVNVGQKVVLRDGYWCVVRPNSKTWIPVETADKLCAWLCTELGKKYRRVMGELIIKPERGRARTEIKDPRELKAWLEEHYPKGSVETADDGWTWDIRVKASAVR